MESAKCFSRKWVERYMKRAYENSQWSKDPSTKVGAVIVDVDRNRSIGDGYNGFPSLIPDKKEWLEVREIKYKYVIHAERNAMDSVGLKAENMAVFLTHPPCSQCFSQMLNFGIKWVYFPYNQDKEFRERWHIDEILKLAEELDGITVKEVIM